MPKFPESPPTDALRDISPDWVTLPTGEPVARVFKTGGDHPVLWDAFRYFGPTASRFDHHLPDPQGKPHLQSRGIMYLAMGPLRARTCLAEVYQTIRMIDPYSGDPALCLFNLASPCRLLDLRGAYETRMGASTVIHSGDRARARRWAQHLYEGFPEAQGILYCSSMHGNEPAIALFEGGETAIPDRPELHVQLSDDRMKNTLDETGEALNYDVLR